MASKLKAYPLLFLLLLLLLLQVHTSNAQSWIKSGYWYAGAPSPARDVNSALFTHLICGFADVDNSTYRLFIPSSDVQNFSTFTDTVKRKNPSIVTLLSIWAGLDQTTQSTYGQIPNSTVLSSMVSQPSHRKSFIQSSIKTARLYGFDGLDLFWVWPSTGSDLINLGSLLDEWRAAINSESRNSNQSQSRLILTMGLYYVPILHLVSYPVHSIRRNLDWAHLIANYYCALTQVNFTCPNAALYDSWISVGTNNGIGEWTRRGLPVSKLVLGLPYFGYAWTLANPNDNGLGAPTIGLGVTRDGSLGYKMIRSLIQDYGNGVAATYNATYVVNYCTIGNTWIGYDDVEAIRAKVSYANEKKLLGYHVFHVTNDHNWELSRAAAQWEDKNQGKTRRLLVIILVPIAMFILLLGITMYYFRRKVLKSRGMMETDEKSLYDVDPEISSAVQELDSNAPNLKVFTIANIKAATNNFLRENKLAEGGFGPVYKGKLPKGQDIAVKRLSKTSDQGLQEFKMEVTLTAKLQHVNLLRVLGYCNEREEKMLVYEYMPNKSLDFYLFDPVRRQLLDWSTCIRIIEGVTQRLLYLQEYSNLTIVHRDLKSSNILLDNEMNPKISDFGMAKIFRKNEREANTGRIIGTYGYVPPEYVRKGTYSTKYDVYSFGVLVLQIISGKKNSCCYGLYENLSLLEYAYDLWREGKGDEFIDPLLDDSSSSCKLVKCMQMALLCVQENPVDRPSMLEVFSILKNETIVVATPKKPAFAIQGEEDEADASIGRKETCSVNEASISDMVPR